MTAPAIQKKTNKNIYSQFYPVLTENETKYFQQIMSFVLSEALKLEASDIYYVSGTNPAIHYSGKCVKLILGNKNPETGIVDNPVLINDKFVLYFFQLFLSGKLLKTKYEKELFETQFYTDLAAVISGTRFRVNIARQKNHFALTMRLISGKIPTPQELKLPESYLNILNNSEGLVLVVGPTGSGKSTSLAALLNEINLHREKHIITLEDPTEYIYPSGKSLIEQKEINQDIVDFSGGVRASLRQKPDIILVGEARDAETIEAVLKSAETGHFVFSTLHSNSVQQTINKLLNYFEGRKQLQIRDQLGDVLKAIFVQRLIPKKGGGKVLCLEIAKINTAIANQIKKGDSGIESTIRMCRKDGMFLFDDYILDLWKRDEITLETLTEYCHNEDATLKLANEYNLQKKK